MESLWVTVMYSCLAATWALVAFVAWFKAAQAAEAGGCAASARRSAAARRRHHRRVT